MCVPYVLSHLNILYLQAKGKKAVVVTTLLGSLCLHKLGYQGQFTHILLDEAAQPMEAETIWALLLAGNIIMIIVLTK